MKYSIYNNIIPLTEKYYLLYNSFTNMYIIFPSLYAELIINKSSNFNIIKNKYPLFYSQLLESKCLVEDSINEVTLLKARIYKVDNTSTEYQLTINPTINCNFRCWYCYEEHLPKSRMNITTINAAKKYITNITLNQKVKYFNLGFFGGEPLIYFKEIVYPLIVHFNSVCKEKNIKTRISFTSNGYLINDEIITLLKNSNVNSFQITLDGCKEQHDKVRYPFKGGSSYDRIVSNIKKLISNQIQVVLRINYTAENILTVSNISNDLININETDKKNLSINFQRVWQDEHIKSNIMIDEHLEKCVNTFRSMGFEVTYRSQDLDLVWNSCYADKTNQVLINYNGDIFKCTARDFKTEKRLGILSTTGEIIWNKEMLQNRNNLRLNKKICYDCRIAPLCGGGCSQRIMENSNSQDCLLGFNDNSKDKVIIDKFYNSIVYKL